jgi:hypothetical protein
MLAPHGGKKFPTLADYMGSGGATKAAPRPVLDTDTAMRRWVAVTAVAQAQTPKTLKKSR